MADERWRLEHPDEARPLDALRGLVLHLRLWRYPRKGAHLSYGLFVPEFKDARALVRELRWNAPADRRRRSSALDALKRRPRPGPAPPVRDALLGLEPLAPFLVEAPEILGAFAERPAEADPDQDLHGIEGFRSLTHARFEWNPPAAHPVAAWVDRLWSLLEAALRDREIA